jgi:hypothetical protein
VNKGSNRPQILYIGGAGRSGSTVAERFLASAMDCFPVGELRRVWDQGITENQSCSCGMPFLECPFWREVFQRAFGGFASFETLNATRLRPLVDRYRRIPWHWMASRKGLGVGKETAAFHRLLTRLYQEILAVSGARFILDSSKDAPYAYVLAANPALDVKLLHLVRDSRAVAFSWQRRRVRPEVRDREEFMLQLSSSASSWIWLTENLFVGAFPRDKFLGRLAYESFVEDPQALVDRLESAGFPRRTLEGSEPLSESELPVRHTVAGNPNRFNRGPLSLRADREWVRKMETEPFVKVTAMTFPLLKLYGYPLRRSRSPRLIVSSTGEHSSSGRSRR